MQLAVAHRGPLARPGSRTARSQGRSAVLVQAVMGPYQFKARVARLRLKGGDVRDFGERALAQGAYGDDVMQLQAYLAERGYFNAADGLSGYFGAVTGEALQNWQRDQGLRVSGVFNDECKWAVLREQEGALKTAQVQAQASIAADAPAGTQLITGAQPGSNAAGLGLAALLAGMLLASPTGRANVVGGVRWTLGAVVGTAVGAATVAWRAARSIRLPKLPNRREEYAAAAAAAAAKAAAEAARRAVAEEMSYLTAAAATPPSPAVAAASAGKAGGATGARRLSEDEVQQRIAVMKGEAGPRAPTPQRPAPKPLSRPASVARPADDPIRASQYGTYYGGRQVRDQVKQYLQEQDSRTGSVSRRLESTGYQMNTRPRAKPASKPAQLGAPSQLAAETKPAAPAPASSSESFSDVNDVVEASAVIEPMSPKQLLKGTELEAAPERRGPPVPVVKVGQAVPLAAQQPDGPPAAAAAPKPVAVIKPQKRSTIGDMLRAARGGPSASTNGAPTNGGYAVVNTQPAPVQPQPASFPSGPAPSGGYPVNTGSRAAAAAAAAAGGSEQTSAEVMPVRYNNDGSVVLASKPIPLVKPAHLLSKTVGFEGEQAQAQEADMAQYGSQDRAYEEDPFEGYRSGARY